jgi:hypothetical protein
MDSDGSVSYLVYGEKKGCTKEGKPHGKRSWLISQLLEVIDFLNPCCWSESVGKNPYPPTLRILKPLKPIKKG